MIHSSLSRAGRARSSQRGFTLVELIVTLSIAAMLAVYAQARIAKESEEQIARAAGSFIRQVAGAAEQHALTHFDDLANGSDIPSTSNDIAPTIAELVAEGLLPSGFPTAPGTLPTRQSLRVDVVKMACPGASCNVITTVCTTTGVTLGRPDVRYDLAQVMVDQQDGTGGLSSYTTPAVIRGPSLNMANPNGAVPGTVCASATLNTAMFQQFVRVRDPRNPDLQGDLSAVGNLAINGTSSLTGEVSTGANIRVAGTGGFGGADPSMLPAGLKGVNAVDLVAAGNIVATDRGAGFNGTNGNYVAMTTNSGGEAAVVTSGRMAGQRIVPTGAFTKGSACVEAGAIALSATEASGSLVVCSSGIWTPLTTVASAGGPCTVEGQTATAASGVTLYCTGGVWTPLNQFLAPAYDNTGCSVAGQVGYSALIGGAKKAMLCRANPQGGGNVWRRLEDLTTNMVFVRSVEVGDGAVIPQPSCANPGNPGAMAIIQLIPKSESTGDGGFARFAIPNGTASWTVRLLNGSGAPMAAGATAVAYVQCFFP
ncbi:MAG: type II secretion system protein [Proteobacteria bacterium]|nr:type II secretion system protein [Pseudomonadota bacterium]